MKNYRIGWFTLLELIIVIACIMILVSILLPAFSLAKARANEIKCSSNLRQTGVSMIIYAQDNNNYVFLYRSSPETGWSQIMCDENFLKNKDICLCPSWAPYKYKDSTPWLSYGVDLSTSTATYPMQMISGTRFRIISKIDFPSRRFALSDSMWSPSGSISNRFNQSWAVFSNASTAGIHFRHTKKTNCLFWDGHTQKIGIKELKDCGFSAVFDLNGNIFAF